MLGKCLGALMIVLACGLGGQVLAGGLNQRKQQIGALIQSLKILATEISFAQNPLPLAFNNVAAQVPGLIGKIYAEAARLLQAGLGITAAQAWQQSLQASRDHLALDEGEWQILLQFGAGLGLSDCQDQLKKLAATQAKLDWQWQEASQKAERFRKIWLAMGWGTGLTLALFII